MVAPQPGFEDAPPPPEEGELRGDMRGHPRYASQPPGSLALRLLSALRRKGEEVIQVYVSHDGDGRPVTAATVARRAAAMARGLAAVGVAPGDAVVVLGAAHEQFASLLIAAIMAGAAFSPLNPRLDDGDLRHLLAIVAPRVVVAVAEATPRLRVLLANGLRSSEGEDLAPPLLVTVGEGKEWDALTALETELSQEAVWGLEGLPEPPTDPRGAVAFIASSSGTTGLPKGVMYTHATLHALLDVLTHPDIELGADGPVLVTSPLFWLTGAWYLLLSVIAEGCCMVNVWGANEEQFLRAIEEQKPRALFTASNFLLSAAKAKAQQQASASSLRRVLCSGSALSAAADAFVQSVFPDATLLSLYGSTEINSGIGITAIARRKTGSVGRLCPFLRCKVVDVVTGRALGPGERGELRFKGPTLTPGYLRNATATEALCDADGWLRSGDLGHYDRDGDFFITGRIKDTIKHRSVHVSPLELEGLLETHSAVQETAVVGVPHPTEQELPRAYVVLRPNAAGASDAVARELQDIVRRSVAEEKWLSGGVVFVPALPKTATGKISRAAVRRLFLGDD